MVTDTDDINLDGKDSVMPLLIFLGSPTTSRITPVNPWATLLMWSPPWKPELQAKIYWGTDLGTRLWCPIGTFRAHKGGYRGAQIPKIHREIPESFISTRIRHPRGVHQGGSLDRHLENTDFGQRQKPGGGRRPPNSNRETIPNPHQLGGDVQRCSRSRSHEGGHGNWGPF